LAPQAQVGVAYKEFRTPRLSSLSGNVMGHLIMIVRHYKKILFYIRIWIRIYIGCYIWILIRM